MNGTMLLELRKYVRDRLGPPAWDQVVQSAGVEPRLYVPLEEYPDAEMAALVGAAARQAATDVQALLQDFGAFAVPDLVRSYGFLIDPGWKTLDLIANTERTIHEVLRRANPKAKPPRLQCERTGAAEVVVTYTSPRQLCALACGLVQGIARHYGETVAVTQPTCLLRGGPRCEIHVRLVS